MNEVGDIIDASDAAGAVTVATFYRFVELEKPALLRTALLASGRANAVLGTIILGHEGINGTVAGGAAAVAAFIEQLCDHAPFAGLEVRQTRTAETPFRRLEIKFKREIVSMGVAGMAPRRHSGTRVEPAAWNALLTQPDVLVLDARNSYEHGVGSFRGALDSGLSTFREFPAMVARQLDCARDRRVAMFCTGGIRCEKASAYLLAHGFSEVYQLAGGILRYLEEVPATESLWQGDCFVFDTRVAVDRALGQGGHSQCHACRRPLAAADRASPLYQPGVSCLHCHADQSAAQRRGFAERRRQVELAENRRQRHIGAVMPQGSR